MTIIIKEGMEDHAIDKGSEKKNQVFKEKPNSIHSLMECVKSYKHKLLINTIYKQ